MTDNFFSIVLSDGSSYKFKAVQMRPTLSQSKTFEKTLGGQLDVHYGNTWEILRYVLKIPQFTVEIGYAVYDDLRYIYSLHNPNAVPSARFKVIDHYGSEYPLCHFSGDLVFEPLTTIIEGECAWFFVPIDIMVDNYLEDSLSFYNSDMSMYIPLL
jgi:hypothetical protein